MSPKNEANLAAMFRSLNSPEWTIAVLGEIQFRVNLDLWRGARGLFCGCLAYMHIMPLLVPKLSALAFSSLLARSLAKFREELVKELPGK